ncbi:DinB superfamily metal-dependent hydrolase [Paenibacillus sp. 32O-W]|uniref:DinB family protein n=1 Tax=Paenibacillus sp. 32O-W TaxID=1695218 RepID=UPI00071EF366|nr:DinB family protein [Paenibacillus sp. 32O-W]ALS28671.1 DinB superfamily metal-dependent hydrolase [Paenibacillus sp. 32O-W]
MPNEIDTLLDAFEEWITFAEYLQSFPEQVWNSSIEEGKWTVRDIVSHMMMWDQYFYEEAIEKIAAGSENVTVRHLNDDDFNSNAARFGRTMTTGELVGKTIDYRRKIIEAIKGMPEETLTREYPDGDGNLFQVVRYVKDFVWHDRHHMNPLKLLLEVRE